jgi:hypothetical protein
MANGQQSDFGQGSLGTSDLTVRLRSRKTVSGTAEAPLSGQQIGLSQGTLLKSGLVALTGSSSSVFAGSVSAPVQWQGQSSGAMIWDEVLAHLEARTSLIRALPLQSSGSTDANLAGRQPANVGVAPGSATGYIISIDSSVKPRGMAGSMLHSISGQSDEDAVGLFINLSEDLLTQIGANDEVFFQFRVRFDTNYINEVIAGAQANSSTVGGSVAIDGLTPGNPTSVQVNAHGLATGDWIFLYGTNMVATKHKLEKVTVTDANNFTVPINSTGQAFGSGHINYTRKITGITKAANGVVTTDVPHGFPVGQYALIRCDGMTELDYHVVRIVSTPTSSSFETDVDTTSYGTFTEGAACFVTTTSNKLAVISAGDTATVIESSCTRNDVVLMGDYFQRRFPFVYHACGTYEALAVRPGGGVNQFHSEFANSTDEQALALVAPEVPSGVEKFFADEWHTIQVAFTFGDQDGLTPGSHTQPPAGPYDLHHCRVRMWLSREDGRQILLHDIGDDDVVNYWNQSATDLILRGGEHNGVAWRLQEIGKFWLTRFQTGKLRTQKHPAIKSWDSQWIAAREFIPDRIDEVAWKPSAGSFNEVAGSNTMLDVGSSPTAGQNQITVLDNWNSAVYAKDVGPYGALVNLGSGHDNTHDAVYGQIIAALAAEKEWKQIFPLSDQSAFSENSESGSDPEGGIPLGVESSPTPPHNYDTLCYIPASVYGNTQGAVCYPMLSAVGVASIPRYWAWFLDLDNAGTEDDCVWEKAPVSSQPDTGVVFRSGRNSTVFDPVGGCVWCLAGGGGGSTHIGKLRKSAGAWGWDTYAHGSGSYDANGELIGGFCQSLDCVIWFTPESGGGPKLHIWKPSVDRTTGTFYYNVSYTGTAPTQLMGMEWCPHPNVQKFYGMEFNRGGSLTYGSITISNGSPAVVTLTGGQTLPPEGSKWFLESDSGAVPPSPLSVSGGYFVRNPSGTTFNISATPTGALINTTSAGSGLHRAVYAYALGHELRTLTPPASLLNGGGTPNPWAFGLETLTAEGGAVIGNDSRNERYNAMRWVWAAKSFAWPNRLNGSTNYLRPAAAT